MYPYNLAENPYPSTPTPGESDILVLGGKRHKKSKFSIVSCIDDMREKTKGEYDTKNFRLVTVIHDVGSGKTHLALHLRNCSELLDKANLSFTDLSQLHPRTTNNFHKAMITGFRKHHIDDLRYAILNYLRGRAEGNDSKKARKIFRYSFWDKIRSTSLGNKMRLILENKISHDEQALYEVLSSKFSNPEISLIQSLSSNKFLSRPMEVNSLEEIITNVCALAKLNLTFLNKISVFEIDEFDSDKHSMDILKALINAHLPSTLLLIVLTPSAYEEIRNTSPSLFDRLEKANYKIDLAGSNTLDEIGDIILEYINSCEKDGTVGNSERDDLLAKIRILYDEFPEFRNIRSMINLMHYAFESAAKSGSATIDEKVLDQTIATVYPSLRLRESIMDVPVSEFVKISQDSKNNEIIRPRIERAIKALLYYASDAGRVNNDSPNFIEVTYDDFVGRKTAIEISIGEGNATYIENTPTTHTSENADGNQKTFSDKSNTENQYASTSLKIDRHKLVDLIYFNDKHTSNQIEFDDIERALALGKLIKLY